MFEFFKRKPKQISESEILKEVSSHLRIEEKRFESVILESENETKIIIEKMRKDLVMLRTAKLINSNIPERHKHFMDGNRDSFARAVAQFCDSFAIPKDEESIQKFEKQVSELGKRTEKAFTILQEFFSKESGVIVRNLKSLELIVQSIKEKRAKLDKLLSLEKTIKSLQELNQRIVDFEKIKKKNKEEIHIIEKRLDETRKKQEKLYQSKSYADLITKRQQKDKLNKQCIDERTRINTIFSIFSASLKKYSKISLTEEKIIESYIQDSYHALLKDNELSIISILRAIEKSTINGSLVFKDKKKDKILETLKKIDDKYLQTMRNNMVARENELKSVTNTVNSHEAIIADNQIMQETKSLEEERLRLQNSLPPKPELDDGLVSEINNKYEEIFKTPIQIINS